QIGAVPKPLYTIINDDGDRGALHHAESTNSTWNYLPESVCDLAAARPVHLAVIDGIKCCTGGEGNWCANFAPAEKHVLIAGLDPVASDSIAAKIMGLNPEANILPLPGPLQVGTTTATVAINYLYLLNQKGAGTNQLNQIQLVGDGTKLVTSVLPGPKAEQPDEFRLCANFPNPFNPSTKIVFYLPQAEFITLNVYDITGREVETLIKGEVPAGEHRLQWSAEGLASGVYLCRMTAKGFSETIKMIYQK
ncbi:MAG: T9SS type A sorting domain-containing protein, partial [Ignavibacteriaceae bacterium]|nr:T9SS type A sorting domain-containing protein [Ignavibacteriaceae bacterium]